MDSAEIMQLEQDCFMPTYRRFPVVLEKGSGATAVSPEGKQYVDFGAGIGVNSLGYCDEGWVQAVCTQARQIQHVSNLYYNPAQEKLGKQLVTLTGMKRVFLGNSGAEANECAIKVARKYSRDKYGDGRSVIITLCNSFHGRTVTTLAATGQESFHQHFDPFTGGFRYAAANDFDALLSVLDDSVCAVMLECVQGEGGVIPLDGGYLKQVEALCREKDLLLVVDEVQTGIARTGCLLACEAFGVEPDVVTLAKGLGGGLPIGACLCGEKCAETLSAGMHGSTFGGNPVACAAASAVLDRVSRPEFLEEVKKKGEYLRKAFLSLPQVEEVRGLGMMLGIRLAEPLSAAQVAKDCVASGLLILTAKTLLRALPPLTITYEEMDRGLAVLASVLCGDLKEE